MAISLEFDKSVQYKASGLTLKATGIKIHEKGDYVTLTPITCYNKDSITTEMYIDADCIDEFIFALSKIRHKINGY